MTLSDDFHKQNQFIQNLKDTYSTNDTKTIYLNEQNDSLININGWLFWIFFVVAILFSIFCFLRKDWSITKKIMITLVVLLYPFYIYYVEKYLLIFGTYVKDMFMGNVYASPDF
jgi:hypothetical protein